MSYIHHDRNNEQILIPITVIRGGTSRGFIFEGKNEPKTGEGLEEFLLAVRGSPDPMGMDGLGGDTVPVVKSRHSDVSRYAAAIRRIFLAEYPVHGFLFGEHDCMVDSDHKCPQQDNNRV